MKRSLIYTAVFSAMLVMTGCGGGDDSSNRNDKENVQLDTSPIKQNTLYGANIDGIPSYYVDDGQNQVSYFNEDNQWYGVVENKDGKTSFSFSEDFTEFTASNNNENQTLKIKQIDDKTVYQTVSDLNGNVLSAFAYFKEDGKTFIAPLDAQNQIDQTQKQDITQEYKNVALQLQQGQISARSVVTNIFSSVSAKGRATFNELMAARSPVSMQKLDCSVSVDEAYDTALEGNFNKTTGKLLGTIGGAVAGNITGIVVGALVGGFLGGVTIPGIGAPIGAKWGATLGAALTTAIFTMQNASGAEIDLNNQQALNKLNLTKKELEELKKLLEEEKKKCLASGMKLINGVCKKEEESKCLADEILVNGICKKKEPICLADEILIDGVCKKQEPKCATDEVLVNGVCKKEEEPQCLADEILVNGICKKKEPICATDEILVNGVCQKIEEKFSGIYKLTFRQTSCTENERTCSFGSDKNIGTLYLYPNKKDGILAVLEGYVSGGAYGYGVKWNLDKNSIEFNNDGFKIKGVRNIMLDSNGSNIVKRDVYVNFKISKENLINKVWSGVWTFDFIDKEQLSYDSKNNIYYYVEKSGKATGTWNMSPFNIKKLPAFTPEISGVCHNSGYIYNFVDAIELSRGADAVLISDNVNKSCTYYQDVYN